MSEQAITGLEVGKKYFFRTVTNYFIGKVEANNIRDVELSTASWIPRTGRYYDCLKTGQFEEIEPYPNGCFIMWQAVIDYSEWFHELPTEQK